MLQLEDVTRDVILGSVAALIDSAGSAGSVDILTADGVLLASLRFSDPVAPPPSDGVLVFGPIQSAGAVTSGIATSARISDGAGVILFRCDVGDSFSDALIRLSTVEIKKGYPVSLIRFELMMPSGQ